MDAKRICPYCMQELDTPEPVCPHCGRSLTGRNPSGSLPVGTVLAGRYTVGEIQSIDGEGILYRGVENKGRFRVTIKEYMPLTLAAERGRDCYLRPKPGSEVMWPGSWKSGTLNIKAQVPGRWIFLILLLWNV